MMAVFKNREQILFPAGLQRIFSGTCMQDWLLPLLHDGIYETLKRKNKITLPLHLFL